MNIASTLDVNKYLPNYTKMVDKNILNLSDNRLVATVKIDGIYNDSLSNNEINAANKRLNSFYNNLAKSYSDKLSIWQNIIKTKDTIDVDYEFDNDFFQGFSDKYLNSFNNNDFFNLSYYVSFVLSYDEIDEGIDVLNGILDTACSTFKSYSISKLGVAPFGNYYRDTQLEHFSYLLTGNKVTVPLHNKNSSDILAKMADLHFGYDLVEIREHSSSESKFAIYYDLDGYPNETENGIWNFLLKEPSEFVLTQSFKIIKTSKSLKAIDDQISKINSAEGEGTKQAEIMEDVKQFVSTGDTVFVDYHCTFRVTGESQEYVLEKGRDLETAFASLGEGTRFIRSNLRSVYSLASMFPAAKIRPLSSMKTTSNMADCFTLHTNDRGKKTGNPIGDGQALMPFKSINNDIYWANLHYSEKGKNEIGKPLAGHTLILGQSGAGKTTVEGVMTGFATRFNCNIFCIDYNRSTELFLRAYGAEYFNIREGVATGINPLQLNDSQQLRAFLYSLLERCAANENGVVTPNEAIELKIAIDDVFKQPIARRTFSNVYHQLFDSELKTRFGQWCNAANGKYAWVFDNDENQFQPERFERIGFDTTELLKLDNGKPKKVTEPLLAILFYFKRLMQQKNSKDPMLVIVEEFWMPANFALTATEMKDTLKAGRMRNEFMILSSQSPEDAIKCDIFDSIIQQTVTKLFLPNIDAEFEGSYERCGMSEKIFKKLKLMDKECREIIIKQSNNYSHVKMDLYGFDEYLPIISPSSSYLRFFDSLSDDDKKQPIKWIPKVLDFA